MSGASRPNGVRQGLAACRFVPPGGRPVRYLDSVNALAAARQRSQELLLAAAVSPFKYREEELVNQYLKAGKKIRAGADFLMTQIGWDLRKYEEARRVLNERGYHAPLMAELLLLTPARSRRIRRVGLAGVTITGDLAQRLEEEAASRDGGRGFAFRRLALQTASVRDLGYAGARVLAPVLRRLDARSGVGRLLLRVEGAIKGPLVGCQTCGFCRLPETAYVCPETCPKGLANGPCGGTKDNVCEFGDRGCIHNQIYRVSKRAGLLAHLEETLITPVPETAWDSCSWVAHFRGEGPKVTRLPGDRA